MLAIVGSLRVRTAGGAREAAREGEHYGDARASSADEGISYLTAFELTIAEVEGLLANAVVDETSWLGTFRRGLGSLVDLLEGRPEVACVLLRELDSPGAARWAETLRHAAGFVERAREEPGALSPPPPTAAAVVAAIYGVLRSELLGSAKPELRAAIPDLTHYAVLPFFGAAVAEREMQKAKRQLLFESTSG